MPKWTATLISALRSRRLLGLLVVISTVLVTALGAPARSSPRSAVGPDATRDEPGISSQWTARPRLQQARAGLGVAVVGGHILAIGGFDPFIDKDFGVVEARRVAGPGTWRYLAPLSTRRGNLGTATVQGRVYAVGGFDVSGPLDVVETFDPKSGRWVTSRRLPQPRGGPGVAALDGLLYVAGGEVPSGEFTNSVVVYDPKKDTWKSVAPMPTARERLKLVASGRYLYAIGGDNRAEPSLATVERYDPKSNTWRTMNPMVQSRTVLCAVETAVGNRRVLVAVGGVAVEGTVVFRRRTTEVFDLDTGRWTLLDVLLPTDRASHDCATEADGTILAIGGFATTNNGASTVPNVDALSLHMRDLR